MENIISIALILPLYVLNCFCDKVCSRYKNKYINIVYTIIKFFACVIILLGFVINDFITKPFIGALICGIVCGSMFAISKVIMLTGYEKSSVSLMNLFHSSGIILPCLVGWIFWSEPFSLPALLGIFVLILAVFLINSTTSTSTKFSFTAIIIGIVIFFASGIIMVVQKIFALYFPSESVAVFNIVAFLFGGLFVFVGKPFMKSTKTKLPIKIILLCALGSAISLVIISQVMTILASKIPSIILFPSFNGLGVLLVTFMSALVFKEKLNKKKLCGVLLGILSLVLISIK